MTFGLVRVVPVWMVAIIVLSSSRWPLCKHRVRDNRGPKAIVVVVAAALVAIVASTTVVPVVSTTLVPVTSSHP
jgi:hypothetical protein